MQAARWLVGLLVVGLGAGQAVGQSVEMRVSGAEAFVGELIDVQVVVSNMEEAVQPQPPETQDFEIIANPGNPVGRSHNVSIINGRRTETVDYTYEYQVRPLRTGRLVLPPFSVLYKGRVYHTQQFPIAVTKDASSAYLFCKITADKESVYVGEAVGLRLEIWVQKYSQPGIGGLDAPSMWSLTDTQASSVGVFDKVDWGHPRYSETARKDEDGVPQQYYVFVLETTVYPTKAGPFDCGNVAVLYHYPKQLARDWFGRYRLQGERRLRATAETPNLMIKPVPTEGRPPDFNGAVGRHAIAASAKPTEVPVGDPITLTLSISGEGSLEQLQPPRLDQVEALRRDFEISGESLAGEIQADRKVFSQTIRALREDVREIPPIPLTYFDPRSTRFVTVHSEPISLTVKPAERLALSQLSGPGSIAPLTVPLVESTEGLERNFDDVGMLLADQSPGPGWTVLAVVLAMPVMYAAAWFVQRRAARYRDDVAWRRRTKAYADARKALKAAAAASSPALVRGALVGYVADRCNAPPGGMTRADAVGRMTERGVDDGLVSAVDALLGVLESAEYGGQAAVTMAEALEEARRLVEALERCGKL